MQGVDFIFLHIFDTVISVMVANIAVDFSPVAPVVHLLIRVFVFLFCELFLQCGEL